MRFLSIAVAFLCALNLCCCSNSDSIYAANEDAKLREYLTEKGFAFIHAKGNSVTLGTDDETASVKDRPTMVASFDYDFWLDAHEVTCGEMELDCGDSLPATDVTYFDAVLYANKVSKAEGFDTACTSSTRLREHTTSPTQW